MIGDVLSIKALAIFLLYAMVKGDHYEDKIGNDDFEKSSLVSESIEAYNKNFKSKPGRITDLKSNLNGDDVLPCKMAEVTGPKEINRRNYKTNYPYSVSIQKKGSHYASGALVDKKWILTVAVEFYNIRESIKLFRARLGSVNCKKGGELVPFKWIEIHPSYVYNQPSFDLAMLRIARPLEFSEFIKPIRLSDIQGQVVSGKFLATYWPRLIVHGHILPQTAKERLKSNSLRVSTQRLIPRNKCNKLSHMNNCSLDASSLCLEPIISHHSPCMPDAGAPIVTEDGLWGITSGWTSVDCSTHPSPTIVTRISLPLMRFWLESLL